MEINYENVKPILESKELEGNMLKCKFKADNQDQPIDAFHTFAPQTKEVMKHAGKNAAKQGIFSSILRLFGGAASSAVGGGTAGYVASSATRSAGSAAYESKQKPDTGVQVKVDENMEKEGIVKAFETVKDFYSFEDGTWKFKAS